MAQAIDVHQHIWTEPLVAALAARSLPPRVRRRGGRWLLEIAGEPPSEIVIDDADARARLVAADGADVALICLSSPVGIEALPRDEAAPLLEAYHAGAFALPDTFGTWGAVALSAPDPDEVDDVLDRGAAGVSLPAGALATPADLEHVGPLLERLEERNAPLFVHPGPGLQPMGGATDAPPWWPTMTTHVAQQTAAWLTFTAYGRAALPKLRVVFALLAGLAPLHAERWLARGGPDAALDDPRIFYDISSYGHRALKAMAACVGPAQLVLGSDRPVIDPVPSRILADNRRALAVDNPARVLGRAMVLG